MSPAAAPIVSSPRIRMIVPSVATIEDQQNDQRGVPTRGEWCAAGRAVANVAFTATASSLQNDLHHDPRNHCHIFTGPRCRLVPPLYALRRRLRRRCFDLHRPQDVRTLDRATLRRMAVRVASSKLRVASAFRVLDFRSRRSRSPTTQPRHRRPNRKIRFAMRSCKSRPRSIRRDRKIQASGAAGSIEVGHRGTRADQISFSE